MEPIRVVVHGALGKMGKVVLNALCHDLELKPVGAVELKVSHENLPLPDGSGTIPISSDLGFILQSSKPRVLVDFSVAGATMPAVRTSVKHRVSPVVGTTGLSPAEIDEIAELCQTSELGGVVAPNFALGAVVMIHLAKEAARFFHYAEIVEMHHETKVDSPSGTALSTAREMLKVRGKPFDYAPSQKETLGGTRGGQLEGIALHSMRMPGLLAHQEVILGATGQTLRIRHDTIGRECYLPGVLLAIKEVVRLNRLVVGLDKLLGL